MASDLFLLYSNVFSLLLLMTGGEMYPNTDGSWNMMPCHSKIFSIGYPTKPRVLLVPQSMPATLDCLDNAISKSFAEPMQYGVPSKYYFMCCAVWKKSKSSFLVCPHREHKYTKNSSETIVMDNHVSQCTFWFLHHWWAGQTSPPLRMYVPGMQMREQSWTPEPVQFACSFK